MKGHNAGLRRAAHEGSAALRHRPNRAASLWPTALARAKWRTRLVDVAGDLGVLLQHHRGANRA